MWGLNSQTNKLMEKSQTLGTNKVFVCYVLWKDILICPDIHINLICPDRNFDHSDTGENYQESESQTSSLPVICPIKCYF